jgi:hypothetical protein
MLDEKYNILELLQIQSTYIIFNQENDNFIRNDITYCKNILIDDEKKIEKIWLLDTDNVIKIVKGRKFKINEKILMIQRYLHNDLNISYKDVLNVEILYTEKGNSILPDENQTNKNPINIISDINTAINSRIIRRYPNEGRAAIDFQATILDTFIDCELNCENITNNTKQMYIFVMVSNTTEKKNIGELVNRYLFIENRETHEYKYSISDLDIQPNRNQNVNRPRHVNRNQNVNRPRHVNRNQNVNRLLQRQPLNNPQHLQLPINRHMRLPLINNPNYIENNQFYSYDSNINSNINSNIWNSISENFNIVTSDEQKLNYINRIHELEQQRERELDNIRQSFFQQGNNSASIFLGEMSRLFSDNFNEINIDDIDYIENIEDIKNNPSNSLFDNTQSSLISNLLNLLIYVNGESLNIGNIENLMEPVRVTVSENDMAVFLTSFKFSNSEEYKQIKIKEQTSCTICLSDYENDEMVSYLNTCNHLFHTTCINKWLTNFNHKCPVCRLSANPSKNNDTLPNDTLPNDTLPNDTLPNDTLPNDTL